MSDIKIEFNSAGFREILLSDGVKSAVSNATDSIASRAQSNTDGEIIADVVESPRMSGYGNGGRWVGFVTAGDYKAQRDEAEDKILSKAVIG